MWNLPLVNTYRCRALMMSVRWACGGYLEEGRELRGVSGFKGWLSGSALFGVFIRRLGFLVSGKAGLCLARMYTQKDKGLA